MTSKVTFVPQTITSRTPEVWKRVRHYITSYFATAISFCSWWRHQMESFSALLALCAENSPVTGEFPTQRPMTRSIDVSFDLRLNKRLSKQSWGWWFVTPSCSLWRHCNGYQKVWLAWFRHGRIWRKQGAVSIRKTVLPGMAIPMLKIRRPNGRLIFNMEIAIRR